MLGTAEIGTLAAGGLRSRSRPNLSHHDHGWHILADGNGLCLTGGHIVYGQPAKAQPSAEPPHLQVARFVTSKHSAYQSTMLKSASTMLHEIFIYGVLHSRGKSGNDLS